MDVAFCANMQIANPTNDEWKTTSGESHEYLGFVSGSTGNPVLFLK
jgi:hypothetical protein